MIQKDRFGRQFWRYQRKIEEDNIRYGYVGKPNGDGTYTYIDDVTGLWWVRLVINDQTVTLMRAVNRAAKRNPAVRYILREFAKNQWEIAEIDPLWVQEQGGSETGTGIPAHTHRIGFGNADMVEELRFEPGVMGAYQRSMLVRVLPFFYQRDGEQRYFTGGTIDLTSNKPASGWAWVKVGLNLNTEALVAVTGDSVSAKSALNAANLASVVMPSGVEPLGGVKVSATTTKINDYRDFMSCRVWLGTATTSDSVVNGDVIDAILLDDDDNLIIDESGNIVIGDI